MKTKAYLYYWSLIPILIGLVCLFNEQIEINVHDSYFVIDRLQVVILLSVFLFISGFGYFIWRKFGTIKSLEKAHLCPYHTAHIF